MIPIGGPYDSQAGGGPLALARAGVVAQVPEHVAGGADARRSPVRATCAWPEPY